MTIKNKYLLTAAGIVLSFVIAVGGWMLTAFLIEHRSNALLSESGAEHIAPLLQPVTERQNLTEQEWFEVLLNRETSAITQAHEPFQGQLSMEEAIEAAKAGLEYFSLNGIMLVDISEDYYVSSAFLTQPTQNRGAGQFMDPVFSFWTITFTDGERKNVNLFLNAVTGHFWRVDIGAPNFTLGEFRDDSDFERVLAVYLSYLNINVNAYNINAMWGDRRELRAYVVFENADVRANFLGLPEFAYDGEIFFRYISIYLSTHQSLRFYSNGTYREWAEIITVEEN